VTAGAPGTRAGTAELMDLDAAAVTLTRRESSAAATSAGTPGVAVVHAGHLSLRKGFCVGTRIGGPEVTLGQPDSGAGSLG
jgi:hypothetical protein